MAEPDQGLQMLLEPEQYETLSKIAHQQGRTLPEVAQEIVRLGLEVFQTEKQRQMEALEHLDQIRQEYHQRNGLYLGDLVGEVRAERQKQIDRVLRGES